MDYALERAEIEAEVAFDWACDNAPELAESGDYDAIIAAWDAAMAEDHEDRLLDYNEDAWLDSYMEDRLGGGGYDDFDCW